MKAESSETTFTATTRLALLISDPAILLELEQILRNKYASFLVLTDKEKLKDFDQPLVLVTDTVQEAAAITGLHPVEGTRTLVILNTLDEEVTAAAINVGAEDCISYPFSETDVFEKVERCLGDYPVKSV